MEPSPPGWYRDPHSPGGRRYWDGQSWVDVDAVLEARAEPGPVATTTPRLISQRRAEPAPAAEASDLIDLADLAESAEIAETTDDVDTEFRPD